MHLCKFFLPVLFIKNKEQSYLHSTPYVASHWLAAVRAPTMAAASRTLYGQQRRQAVLTTGLQSLQLGVFTSTMAPVDTSLPRPFRCAVSFGLVLAL